MDISTLTKIPKLVKIEITDEEIVNRYGEVITFWMIDELGLDSYFKFYRLQQEQKTDELNELLRTLIRKADGTPAISTEQVLPVDLVLAVLVGVNDFLGKSKPKTSANKTGNSPK
ncbi:hypothetical protein UFOVP1634_13 [uncultured Caudovirales phage]|uniref:Tail assembly chaperone n=1 Tax=uncultured Caudovirales phage TaxID=2100421 RepID=A0A6J5QBI8_9CAUD|nr:hypothetical protein UFOVP1030_28 [uncultured Caudovirales phage]CAB4220298.1 hypothetical protein UFOVP1634_13 [uncultured Caudovirales phage]